MTKSIERANAELIKLVKELIDLKCNCQKCRETRIALQKIENGECVTHEPYSYPGEVSVYCKHCKKFLAMLD